MSRAVLISVKPKWCELIANGWKTIEVRKTKPKLEAPFKCYIYCTCSGITAYERDRNPYTDMPCTVIGEFVCDKVLDLYISCSDPSALVTHYEVPGTCLTDVEIMDYLGNGKTGYGWHISDLVIYDKPKELSEFYRWEEPGTDIRPCQNGKNCKHIIYDYSENCEACAIDFDGTDCPYYKMQKAPQSWCYVEEVAE